MNSTSESPASDQDIQNFITLASSVRDNVVHSSQTANGIKDSSGRLHEGWRRLKAVTVSLVQCSEIVDIETLAAVMEKVDILVREGDQLIAILRPKRNKWRRIAYTLFTDNEKTEKRLRSFFDEANDLDLDVISISTNALTSHLMQKIQIRSADKATVNSTSSELQGDSAGAKSPTRQGSPRSLSPEGGYEELITGSTIEVPAIVDVMDVSPEEVTVNLRLNTDILSEALGRDVELRLDGNSSIGEVARNKAGESILRLMLPRKLASSPTPDAPRPSTSSTT